MRKGQSKCNGKSLLRCRSKSGTGVIQEPELPSDPMGKGLSSLDEDSVHDSPLVPTGEHTDIMQVIDMSPLTLRLINVMLKEQKTLLKTMGQETVQVQGDNG
jgi:hypothetical protein